MQMDLRSEVFQEEKCNASKRLLVSSTNGPSQIKLDFSTI
jgi:hypothetical protein